MGNLAIIDNLREELCYVAEGKVVVLKEFPIMNDLKTIIITHVDDMLKNICKNRESIATSTVNSHLPKLPAPSGADSKSETFQFKRKKLLCRANFFSKSCLIWMKHHTGYIGSVSNLYYA